MGPLARCTIGAAGTGLKRGRSKEMEHGSGPQLLLCFALLYVLCTQALALPPLGTMRLGNRMPFDGASESDHSQGSLKSEADILQTTLPENDKFYYDVYRAKQMAVKKYLNSVLTGKRSQEELNPASLRDETELLDPAFSENYDDDVTVDDLELLNHHPLLLFGQLNDIIGHAMKMI
ncbi:VIP peptides-like [Zootoca vivipara]|uniref:VIP peptides-like n=1 Tax=Zootoca vivipara TaxID=8524 RepID=UPI00293C001A|nr:VIP peptides-like [Zootoca vivipara]